MYDIYNGSLLFRNFCNTYNGTKEKFMEVIIMYCKIYEDIDSILDKACESIKDEAEWNEKCESTYHSAYAEIRDAVDKADLPESQKRVLKDYYKAF